jgi:hypothetical protein
MMVNRRWVKSDPPAFLTLLTLRAAWAAATIAPGSVSAIVSGSVVWLIDFQKHLIRLTRSCVQSDPSLESKTSGFNRHTAELALSETPVNDTSAKVVTPQCVGEKLLPYRGRGWYWLSRFVIL